MQGVKVKKSVGVDTPRAANKKFDTLDFTKGLIFPLPHYKKKGTARRSKKGLIYFMETNQSSSQTFKTPTAPVQIQL